jgi:uncharacterized protein (TIGR02145 family)
MGRIGADFLRKLKHTVNKVSSLRGFTGNKQGNRISKPRRGDTLLTARFNVRKLGIKNYKLYKTTITMKKKILVLFAIALVLSANLRAQVTIGSANAPKAGAILELNSATTGGLLLSNVDLDDLSKIPATGFVGISSVQDRNSELVGMIVYNTNATTGAGIHFWDGDDWIKPCAPPAPEAITFSATTFLAGVKYAAIVAPVTGATSYVWTLPPEFTVFGASDGATITFSAPAGTYSIVVRAKNACGESSRYRGTQQITVTAITNCTTPTLVITPADAEFINNNTPLYTRNSITLSTPVKITVSKTDFAGGSSPNFKADYRDHSTNPDYGSWFSWCMVAQYNDVLCPGEWRVPSVEDFCKYANGSESNTGTTGSIYGRPADQVSDAIDGWLLGGYADGSYADELGSRGHYWSSTEGGSSFGYNALVRSINFLPMDNTSRYYGFSLRCVK